MTTEIKPFSPEDALESKIASIPQQVIQAVNEFLALRYNPDDGSVIIKQDEIIQRVIELMNVTSAKNITSSVIFDNHWMDFEPLFRQAGWKVEYDKPGYSETYQAFFSFTRK